MPEHGDRQPPSEDEVQAIRDTIKEHVSEFPDAFWERDVERLMKDDSYVHRFFWHAVPDTDPNQVSLTVDFIKQVFQWRKTNDPAGIKPTDISPALKETGSLYLHGKDCDGKPLMVLCFKRHHKGVDSMENKKKLVHFYIEKVDKETKDGLMSLVIDCVGGGLAGFDLELIRYLITAFKECYPLSLNYIIVLEMPWILNAAWAIIKPLLPVEGVRKLRFVTRSNMSEYIPQDQQLSDWGGCVEWTYNFEDTISPL